MSAIRWLPRLIIPLAIVAALLIDIRDDSESSVVATDDAQSQPQIAVPAADALTSSWFCPAVAVRPMAPGFGEVTAEVLLTNMTGGSTSVSIEFRGRTTGRQYVTTQVAPFATEVVSTSDYVRDEIVGALVEASSGGLAVTRRFESPLGIDESRCSSVLAPDWYVPVGDTLADALTVLAIMNPLPRDAIVDVTFASEAEFGPFVAPALTGVVVPASSTVAIDVGEHARRRDAVAASVRARTGRIAVDSLVAYDGSIGRRGIAVELASVASGERWMIPTAGIGDETRLWVRVFNPSDRVAEVVATVLSDDPFGDRLTFAVPSHDVAELTVEVPTELAPALDALLMAPGIPFGLALDARNDVPIVVWAETLVGSAANPLTDIAPGASADELASVESEELGETADAVASHRVLDAQSGLAFVPGIAQVSDRWLAVAAPESGGEVFLTVMADPWSSGDSHSQDQNGITPAPSPHRVVVGTLSGETVAAIDVPASGVITHRMASGTARLIVSDTPFAALVWQVRIGGAGVSVAHPAAW